MVRQVVGTDPDVGVRYTGRCMLFRRRVRMPGVDVTPPEGLRPHQIARLLDRADAYTRIRYARSLCQAYGPGVLPVLAAHLRPDEDPWVLSAVIQAFRRHGCPEDISRILPFLRHPDPRVVADSIEALSDLDPRRSLPYLGTFLRSPDNRIQANAIVACHDLAPRRAIEALRGLARRPEVWMRVSALYCIDALDGSEILRIAEAMGREEREPWIRKRIERILETKASDIVLRDAPAKEEDGTPSPVLEAPAQLRDTTRSHGAPGDRDLLVAALREDLASEEPAVRSSAVLALAQNVDPRCGPARAGAGRSAGSLPRGALPHPTSPGPGERRSQEVPSRGQHGDPRRSRSGGGDPRTPRSLPPGEPPRNVPAPDGPLRSHGHPLVPGRARAQGQSPGPLRPRAQPDPPAARGRAPARSRPPALPPQRAGRGRRGGAHRVGGRRVGLLPPRSPPLPRGQPGPGQRRDGPSSRTIAPGPSRPSASW